MDDGRTDKLRDIRDEILALKESPLYEYRVAHGYKPVIGEGDHYAEVFFLGEAPGEQEAKTGHHFVGRSGKILDMLLKTIGLSRKDIYIANVVKDRPPGNRDPKPDEIEIYAPFLLRQVDLIQPKILVPLGKFGMEFAAKNYGLEKELQKISHVRGNVFETKTSFGIMKVIPQLHPAVATYNRNMLEPMKEDFRVINRELF